MNPIDQAIILDEARKYTDSQRLAYSISNTMTFNGNPTGKDCIDDFMVKISDKTLTNEEIESITMYDHSINGGAGGFGTIAKEHLVFSNNGSFREIGDGDATFAVIVDKTFEPGDGSTIYKGTYVMCAIIDGKMYGYVSEIKCFETIHPIDPKFLPGVCLPVVELSAEIASGENVLTEAESAAINASFDYGLPLVIKFKTSAAGLPGVEASAILEYCSVPDFVTGYSAHIALATAAPGTLIVQKNESGDFVAIFTPDNA